VSVNGERGVFHVGFSISSPLPRFTFPSLFDEVQVNQVRSEMDRLAREKIDTSALEHYTARVTTLFEQVVGRWLESG
jgi:hypothetical protein